MLKCTITFELSAANESSSFLFLFTSFLSAKKISKWKGLNSYDFYIDSNRLHLVQYHSCISFWNNLKYFTKHFYSILYKIRNSKSRKE